MNAYLFISIGLVGGLAISSFVGAHFYHRLDAKWSKLLAIHDLSNAHIILEALRSDKTAYAIKVSELLLDAGIVGLGGRLRLVPPDHRDEDDVYWLRKAKEYRAKYPRISGPPEIDLRIAAAFALTA